MEAYFERDGVAIYHGDCRELLALLPRDSVDVIVTDPPYGIEYRSARRTDGISSPIAGDADLAIAREGLAAALRLLRRHRHVYAFASPAERAIFEGLPIGGAAELVWNKGQMNAGDLALPWGNQHELIMFGVYAPSPANRKRGDGRLAARLRQGSVITEPRVNAGATGAHPTEKPVRLLRRLIESSSLLGEAVLDPFAGSGSTLVAALNEGRSAIGIEIEERYCEVAAERLRLAATGGQ